MTPISEIQSNSRLDLTLLQNIRIRGTNIIAQCPACAADGGDNKGLHLIIFPTGAYGCVVSPGDSEHCRRIFSLVGTKGASKFNSSQRIEYRKKLRQLRQAAIKTEHLVSAVQSKRDKLIERYKWTLHEMLADSPQQHFSTGTMCKGGSRNFLASLFHSDGLLWTGEVYESGHNGKYHHRWMTCREWCGTPAHVRVGPMVAPGIFAPETSSRSATAVISAPYVVLDFDGFDGVKPSIAFPHVNASLAIIRWLREARQWKLAAIVWTGNKSLHAWFHSPPQQVLQSLTDTAVALGIDAGLIGHPEHPCRLPGHPHSKSGYPSRVLWLQNPTAISTLPRVRE